jgi:hypothetical protein
LLLKIRLFAGISEHEPIMVQCLGYATFCAARADAHTLANRSTANVFGLPALQRSSGRDDLATPGSEIVRAIQRGTPFDGSPKRPVDNCRFEDLGTEM